MILPIMILKVKTLIICLKLVTEEETASKSFRILTRSVYFQSILTFDCIDDFINLIWI